MADQNLIVILVEPQGPINIGSICRTMMNFGVKQLRLVNPTKEYKSLQAKKMALSAFTILENAPVFDDLASALADVQVHGERGDSLNNFILFLVIRAVFHLE